MEISNLEWPDFMGSLQGQPYKNGTLVTEKELSKGENIYFVENENYGDANPGGFGSKNPTYTIYDLRYKLAVLENWKKIENTPTLRAYTIKKKIRVREGTIGPQLETTPSYIYTGVMYPGGAHQYEIIDVIRGTLWKEYFEEIIAGTITLKK